MNPIESIQHLQLNPKKNVICAVSGGVDSMVLLHALYRLRMNGVVVHVNHQLRDEANLDEALVKAKALEYGFAYECHHASLNPEKNIQNQGHQIRLKFFQDIAEKYNINDVLLAHHLDDQLEHFLIQIVRGFDASSYVGMPVYRTVKSIQLIRPFLELPKQTLVAYAQENEIEYREDESNHYDGYLRNRIRHHFIPKVKSHRPDFLHRFLQAQNTFRKTISKELQTFLAWDEFNTPFLDAVAFQYHPIKLQHRLINQMWTIQTKKPPLSDAQLTMILKRLNTDLSNVRFELSDSHFLSRDYKIIQIQNKPKNDPLSIHVQTYGKYPLNNEASIEICAQKKGQQASNYLELCYNISMFPLTIRTAKNGDVLGFKYGHKKLSQWFKDHKIPIVKRDRILVIERKNEIVGVLHPKYKAPTHSCLQKVYVYEVKNA